MTSHPGHGRRYASRRRFVVWLTHAPGLWLFYGERLPRQLRPANVIAASATIVAMAGAVLLARGPERLRLGALVWLIGHVGWGTYLARRLAACAPLPSRPPPIRVRALQCDDACAQARDRDETV